MKCSGSHQHRGSHILHHHGIGTMVVQTDKDMQSHHHCDDKCLDERYRQGVRDGIDAAIDQIELIRKPSPSKMDN